MQDLATGRLTLPLIALRGLTIFPGMTIHFDIGRAKSLLAIEEAMRGDHTLFLVCQRDIRYDDPGADDLYEMGTVSVVKQLLRLPGDSVRIMVEGKTRASLIDIVTNEPYATAEVEIHPPGRIRIKASYAEALIRETRELFEEYTALAPKLSDDVTMNIQSITDPGQLADYVIQSIALKYQDRQTVLEELHPVRRIERAIAILTREIEILSLTHNIHSKVREQINKNQKEYYLREQIKAIQQELGEREDIMAEADEYRDRIFALHLPNEHTEKLLKEAARLSKMHSSSAESGVIRTYLDTCLELPWNKTTKDVLDTLAAKKTLDRDHYGMEEVKERILEFLAVKRLAPELRGQIICLVGPPGVGKTSIAMSIAKAMKRKLSRVSLGGMRDEADIRGHRKTYIGAMPGRVMTALSQAGSKNPVIVLDEIDKMGHDFRGDPAAALLELLDPEQNHSFRDHYIELPFDLSSVLFITTANTTETIPRPLLDRMEIISLSSYTDEEKVKIATGHLIPKQLKLHGLKKQNLRLTDKGLRLLISGYTKESGVRQLERRIASLCRKTAREIVESPEENQTHKIDENNLVKYLGPIKYRQSHQDSGSEVGVVNGLAWTSVGGELLEVEVNVVDGSGKIEMTGNLGDVMKESVRAALSFIRSRVKELGIDPDFYKNRDIHIHFPEGAVPKDGPSAGIAITTAMVSALTGRPVKKSCAMTGEITLRGRVLAIGGLKEKTMAALRAGVKTVIIPFENEPDLEKIDQLVREKLQFIPVKQADEVIQNALEEARI